MTTEATKKPTAAQRRQAAREAEQQELARKLAEFEAQKSQVWLTLWAGAMQLWLQLQDEPECREAYSWHFEEFDLKVKDCSFRCYQRQLTKDTLTLEDATRATSFLAEGASYLTEHLEAKERARLEALEQDRKRKAALSLLTAEQVALLGINLRFGERDALRV